MICSHIYDIINLRYIQKGERGIMNQKTADDYSSITPKIKELSQLCMDNSGIDKELYVKYHVYRGLRDLDGNGVLTGLTEISDIVSKQNAGRAEDLLRGRALLPRHKHTGYSQGFYF